MILWHRFNFKEEFSGRGYFGLATQQGILLAFGGRDQDDHALATVGSNVN